jgi:outer membrane protein OmpA-like peptidoglycan-associated protein
MKTNLILASALALGLAGTGCATKKYVAQSVADAVNPVQARVGDVESKNGTQDTKLDEHGQQIDTLETSLSRTNERLSDADAKAIAAGQAAQQADSKAVAAQQAANTAQTTAQRGLARAEELDKKFDTKIEAANRYQMVASETVLFDLNSSKLDADSKAKLDDIAKRTGEHARFIVEIQGFTDKTGSPEANELLSEHRADSVTRYLVNEHNVPLRNVTTLGSGYAMPVGDDKTRDGRKMNRRVEIRLFVPEAGSSSTVASND